MVNCNDDRCTRIYGIATVNVFNNIVYAMQWTGFNINEMQEFVGENVSMAKNKHFIFEEDLVEVNDWVMCSDNNFYVAKKVNKR